MESHVKPNRIAALATAAVLMTVSTVTVLGQAGPGLEVVKPLDPTQGQVPEGITVEADGDMIVTMGLPFFVGVGDGRVTRIEPDGTMTELAFLPDGQGPAGVVSTTEGEILIARGDPMSEATRGVWRLTGDGAAERLPGTEAILLANGLALDGDGGLFVSDTALGIVWHLPIDGSSPPEAWFADPALLGGCAEGDFGVNGIALSGDSLYAAATSKGLLVSIPITDDGSAGEPTIVAGDEACEPDAYFGLDGIALDTDGNIYAALVLQNQLVKIDADDGSLQVLATADDGLHNPASVVFGTTEGDRTNLYVTNYALLPPIPDASAGPAVLRYDVGVEGLPLR
jgi:sugar lactone lactonase YvrE